jgi:hypothetical protein
MSWTPQRPVRLDFVVISAANLPHAEVAAFHEVHDDSVRGSFCDAHHIGDLTDTDVGLLSDCQQDTGMVRKEMPLAYRCLCACPARHTVTISESSLVFLDTTCMKWLS